MIGRFPLNLLNPVTYTGGVTNPIGIALDSSGGRLAVAQYTSDVIIYNISDMSIITTVTFPSSYGVAGLGYDSVNNRFLVGEDNNFDPYNNVAIINGVTYAVTNAGLTTVSSGPTYRGFQFDYTNDKMFVSCYGSTGTQPVSKIAVYKISDLSLITSFDADKCCGIQLDTANNKLYVAGHSSANVRIYDATTYSLLTTIPTGGLAYGITQDPDISDYMIVQNYGLNQLQILSKATNTIVGAYSGIPLPRFSVINGGKIYTTLANPLSKVAIMDRFYI